jgi:flavin-dependent dehydrogenase
MTLPSKVDLCVVGAGTAGAALSFHAASRGLRVLCLDRRPLDGAGARWVNGVGRTDFAAAGIDVPTGPELRGGDSAFHLTAGWGPERLTLRDHGVLEVDMRHLVARLQTLASEAGAHVCGEVRVEGVEGHVVRTSAGSVEADVVADASGLGGAKLLPSVPVPSTDICAAAQAVHEVADPAGARAFLDAHGVGEDETLCFSGVAGGYSIVNVRVAHGEVGLLTGSIPADGHRSGRRLIADFLAEQPWIGAEVFGGHRAIPLGQPQPVLTRGRIVRLGDSAGQVFAAHGSGIAAGMVAARMLAEALADGEGPNDYAVRWMRTHGGVFAAYDCFRRFSQRISLEELRVLFQSGLIDEASAAAGLAQTLPRFDPGLLVRMPGGLARAGGRLARSLASTAGRMGALMALYRAYPRSDRRRATWMNAVTGVG